MSKKIKVAGYTKKINYTDGISYRPFSTLNKPLEEGTIFSAGNFNVTINTDQHVSKLFKTKEFSDYFDLDSLSIDDVKLTLINDITTKTKLNLNNSILKNYAYFGSLKERLRVSLEKIIINFPAAIVSNPYYYNDNYDLIYNGAIKDIDKISDDEMVITFETTNFSNPYDININQSNHNGLLFNDINKWRDFTSSYSLYSVVIDDVEFDIIGIYENTISSLRVIVKLNEDLLNKILFENIVYIRPNRYEIESFYNSLDSFELEILNRNSLPKNTYNFIVREFKDNGIFVETNKKGTWTTSDGYNLDFDNPEYLEYINKLISLCDDIDMNSSNLIIRQMVATSLLEFDTVSSDVNDNVFNSSQKIKSVLSIYGRSFDNAKNYIDGIAFANNVTYDKEDNTPDKYLREIAKSYGWDMFDNQHYIDVLNDTLVKDADNFTKEELENELWRRLILNTPYLWRSKGTRKAIEFIIKFLGIPRGMITFNEFIYKTKNKLNYDDVETIVDQLSNDQNILDLPLDQDGYPKIPSNNDTMYYQKAGGWYSITGGENSDIDTNLGNNPHMGGYDSGVAYLNQFKNIVNNFEPVKEIDETIIISEENWFKSYDNGKFDLTPIVTDLSNTIDATAYVLNKLPITTEYDDCGCIISYQLKELYISPIKHDEPFSCDYEYTIYNENGIIDFYRGVTKLPSNLECCSMIGGDFVYNFSTQSYVCTYKSIIDCSRYQYLEPSGGFAVFRDLATNQNVTVIPYAECCPVNSTPVGNEADGYRCQIGIDVTNMCIQIDAVYINAIDDTNESFIQYTDAIDGNTKRTYMVAESQYTVVDEIIEKNADIIMSHDGYSNSIYFNDFVAQTGSLLTNINNLTVTFIMTGLPVSVPEVSFVISYVDCPTPILDDNCLKLESIEAANNELLLNMNISYISERNDSMIVIQNPQPTNSTPSKISLNNGYDSNIVKKGTFITIIKNGNIIELDTNEIILIKNPTLNDGLEYFYGFIFSGVEYRLFFKYLKCPDCHQYDTYRYVDGTNIINENAAIVLFTDDTNNVEFYSVISSECCPINTIPVTYNNNIYCKKMTELISFRMDSGTSGGIGNCPNGYIELSDTYYTNNFNVGGILYYDIYGNDPFGSASIPNMSTYAVKDNIGYSITFNNGTITHLTVCQEPSMPLTFTAEGESQKLKGVANVYDDGTANFAFYEIQYRLSSSTGSWTSFNVTYQAFVSVAWQRTGVSAGTYDVRCRMITTTNKFSRWFNRNNVIVPI